jgi:hypothetical protein
MNSRENFKWSEKEGRIKESSPKAVAAKEVKAARVNISRHNPKKWEGRTIIEKKTMADSAKGSESAKSKKKSKEKDKDKDRGRGRDRDRDRDRDKKTERGKGNELMTSAATKSAASNRQRSSLRSFKKRK